MDVLFLIFLFILGLIIGSFLTAFTWRWPRGENFFSDRSRCDKCHKLIFWYDNIPLLSYLLLGGKCRNCKTAISVRYPIIEFSTAVVFLGVFQLGRLEGLEGFGILNIAYYILLSVLLIAIFIIDFELQIIPDELVFLLLFITFMWLLVTSNNLLFQHLFVGLSASVFLLFINFITRGRGMGLGDVKFVVFGGLFFGYPLTIVFIFLSFLIGALIGTILIFLGKAKFGRHIAFGPFLVLSFFITFFWGEALTHVLLPYL